jgi:soluble lytic murein transglycosylase
MKVMVLLRGILAIALLTSATAMGADTSMRLGLEDLAPYWGRPELAEARNEFERGRYRKAQALLGELGDEVPVRFLWAQSALRAGDSLNAANELASLANRSPELSAYCHAQAGRAFEVAGRPVEATAHYAAVARDSFVFTTSRLALARILRKRGDLRGAIRAIAPLTEPSTVVTERDRADAWVTLAELSRVLGRPGDERRAWLALWATEPQSAQASRAEVRQAGLSASDRWKVIRAQTLISQNFNREGLAIVERLVARQVLPDELACRAHLALGTALRKERRHVQAINALKPVVERCLSPELRPRALFVLGYSQSVVAPQAAIETYETLATEYPDVPYADDALFFASDLRLRRSDVDPSGVDRAMADLRRIVVEYPRGNFAADALFKQFWVHRSEGAPEEALLALEELETLAPEALSFEQQQQARYWRARTLELINQKLQARWLLEQIAVQGATTYYGLLARSRLRAEAPEREWEFPSVDEAEWPQVWPLNVGMVSNDPHFRTGIELVRLGNPAGAIELLSVGKRLKSGGALRAIFHVLRAAGYKESARIAAKQLVREGVRVPSQEEARLLYDIGYPDTFRDLVEVHSKAAQVDPDLMQALIREESSFNPRARSATGALGLAQLMPGTAVRVANSLRRRVTQTGLFDPKQNIRLGSAYLGDLSRQFEGNSAHAIASYNAGPAAVNRWLKGMPGAELDEWVETIPVDETRRYVKRVLGSYGAYQLLSASDDGVE